MTYLGYLLFFIAGIGVGIMIHMTLSHRRNQEPEKVKRKKIKGRKLKKEIE